MTARAPERPAVWRSSRWISPDADLAGAKPTFAAVECEADGRQIILREFENLADARTYVAALRWGAVPARLVVIVREIEPEAPPS